MKGSSDFGSLLLAVDFYYTMSRFFTIDYVMVAKRFRSTVNINSARSFPGSQKHVANGHAPVVMIFWLRVTRTSRRKALDSSNYDTKHEKDLTVADGVQHSQSLSIIEWQLVRMVQHHSIYSPVMYCAFF